MWLAFLLLGFWAGSFSISAFWISGENRPFHCPPHIAQNIEAELLPASSPDPGGAYCTDTPPRRQPLAVEPVILPRRYAFRCRLYFVDFYACNCPANLITTITRCRRSRGSHDFERVEGFPTRPHLLRSVKYKITHDPSHAAIKQKDEGHR